jgi:hypothetical protein
MIGDGTSLSISRTGFVSLPTSTIIFTLDDGLCVPTTKKNLISISQFHATNDASIELFSSSFHVKDIHTGAILLTGIIKDGVYEWPTTHTTWIFLNSSLLSCQNYIIKLVSPPAFPILKHVIYNYQLASSSPLPKGFSCNACLSNKSHKLHFSISSLNSTQPLQIIFFGV